MKTKILTNNNGQIIEDRGDTIRIFVPIKFHRYPSRKKIVLPKALNNNMEPTPLVIALARANLWQKWLDDGKFKNAKELASYFKVDPSLVRRILRLNIISPKIIEKCLNGKEPNTSLQAIIDMDMPVLWSEQEKVFFNN